MIGLAEIDHPTAAAPGKRLERVLIDKHLCSDWDEIKKYARTLRFLFDGAISGRAAVVIAVGKHDERFACIVTAAHLAHAFEKRVVQHRCSASLQRFQPGFKADDRFMRIVQKTHARSESDDKEFF